MSGTVNYTLSFKRPSSHYCEVAISIENFNDDYLFFSMPVWTPGSYLVREFARNVENVSASDPSGKKVNVEKIDKHTWKVDAGKSRKIKLSYEVYCNELTVRTSEVNSEHAFINGAGVFMYAQGYEKSKCVLKISCPPQWKEISTGLTKVSGYTYSAENYDVFIDSPIETGNQKILEFKIKGISHYICLAGKGNYNDKVLIEDFRKIAEEEIRMFRDIPYKNFNFIIHLVEKGGGGLEHHNSFVAHFSGLNFSDKLLYKKFLGLVSHEFFHLWNVKRIRPEALGPFDYSKENYTKSLWVSEGWTSFYDNLILRRCGILDDEEYFEFADVEINDIMRFQGRFKQSLAESSFDTWIKFYRKDENFNNSQVSYYTKGALAAMMLNIEIIKSTKGKKSLDDVLRILYDDYIRDDAAGFSESGVKEICEYVSGKNLDAFWKNYINGTSELPLGYYLKLCGLELVNVNEKSDCTFDIESKNENGKFVVAKVFAGGTAYESGLNSGDEIIGVNGYRIGFSNIDKVLKSFSVGDKANVIVSRGGLIKELSVKFLKPIPKYKLQKAKRISKQQGKYLRKWLDDK